MCAAAVVCAYSTALNIVISLLSTRISVKNGAVQKVENKVEGKVGYDKIKVVLPTARLRIGSKPIQHTLHTLSNDTIRYDTVHYFI